MFLGPVITQYDLDDKPWLGTAHGTDATESITLDLSLFTAATHYPAGALLSGIALGRVTASKLFGPYDATKSNGQETLVGHLYGRCQTVTGQSRYLGALYTHGKVRLSRLPAALRPDAAGQADVAGAIRYI